MSWMDGWKPTKYPGVFEGTGENRGSYRIRFRVVNSATGKLREVNRIFDRITIKEALIKQQELREEAAGAPTEDRRFRVGDFATLWLDTKTPTLDKGTADRYAAALDDHILPVLGDHYYDALRSLDVQKWVNDNVKKYRTATVHGWFRVLRTMTRDAVEQLNLERDPTNRIVFPDPGEKEEANALEPAALHSFLSAMERDYPRNYALTCTLAFTGLRFCHASAIKWEDIDEEKGVIRIVRKNVRGRLGPVSRKKRAPKEYPLDPELARILQEQRLHLVRKQNPGLKEGWVFPGRTGELRTPGSLWKAWKGCLAAIELGERFTVHGLRRTFNDLARRGGVDAVVTKSLTGHVTEKMREHYSSVGLDEKRQAVGAVVKLVVASGSGDRGGDRQPEKKKAG